MKKDGEKRAFSVFFLTFITSFIFLFLIFSAIAYSFPQRENAIVKILEEFGIKALKIDIPFFRQILLAPTGKLLQASDLIYLGAFRLPTGIPGSTFGFSYAGSGGLGAYAVAYNPSRNSLFIGGHPYDDDFTQKIAEIAIPSSFAGTPTASALSNFRDPLEGRMGSINPSDPNQKVLGSAIVFNNKLYIGAYSYYDGSATQTNSEFSRPVDLSVSGQVIGPVKIGNNYPGWVDKYAAFIPIEWQSYFEGPAFAGGSGGAINSLQSWGPSATVFDPNNIGVVNPVPGVLVLGYPWTNPTLGGNGAGNIYWSQADVISGMAFPSGTNTVLYFGKHGMGNYCYGTGGSSGGDCFDPDDSSKGIHTYPYRSQIWAYDANELLAVKNGTKSYYQVIPYAVWEFSTSFKDIQGVGYDPTNQRLYVSQPFGDGTQPLVRVYQINVATPLPTVTITAPTSGSNVTNHFNVLYSTSGNLSGVAHADLQIDSGTIIHDTDFDGSYTFTNVSVGLHTVRVFLVNSTEATITSTSVAIRVNSTLIYSSGSLVQASDLVYQGAFRYPSIPDPNDYYGGDRGSVSLSYYPSGNPTGPNDGYPGSLFAVGHRVRSGKIGEISIPAPIIAIYDHTALSSASQLQPLADISDSVSYNGELDQQGGILYLSARGVQTQDRLYWSKWMFYAPGAQGDHASFGFSSLDLSQTNDARGVWRLGPAGDINFHEKRTSRYLFEVPLSFANQYLGGRSIIGGNADSSGSVANSHGPPMVAFSSVSTSNPPVTESILDGQVLVMYPGTDEGCASGTYFPSWNCADQWPGGTWIDYGGKSAITIASRKGVGAYCYGEDFACNDVCGGGKGDHAYPYEARLYFYDPADLAAVAQGIKQPQQVLPYLTYTMTEFFGSQLLNSRCPNVGGITVDNQRGYIYVNEGSAPGIGAAGSDSPIIHVYKVNAVTSSTTLPVINILSPTFGEIVGQNFVAQYQASGNLTSVHHADLQIDSGTIFHDTDFDGSYSFSGVAGGNHTLTVTLKRINDASFANSESVQRVNFTVPSAFSCTDFDLDGYNTTAGSCGIVVDCNDNNAGINPGVLEICGDGIDNNCAGGVDEGCAIPTSFCAPLSAATGTIITVSPSQASSLDTIVSTAATGTTILLQDGTYVIDAMLDFNNPRVTLRSQSGNRDAVIIDGNYVVGEVIYIDVSNAMVADLTIRKAFYHDLHAVSGADNLVIYNVKFLDARQQFVKVNSLAQVPMINGTLACSYFELTDAGRPQIDNVAGISDCYTGGFDAHDANNWIVRDNVIKNIYCSGRTNVAEHGIHFWQGGLSPLIERNILINNSRGIGLGLIGNGITGGTIRNNFIYANIAQYDSGIGIEDTPSVLIYHNTIYSTQGVFNVPIDLRGTLTTSTTIVRNNLHEPVISVRNGATPIVSNNVRATAGMFVNLNDVNLHLLSTASSVINQGVNVGVTQDIDGDIRDTSPDVGADEFVSGAGDTISPTVSITSPVNGAIVSVTINVNATASDNVGVVGVQFLLDGANLGSEDLIAPYSISWNTASAVNGTHVLSARARDAAGNNGANNINVNVQNVPLVCFDGDGDLYNQSSAGCGAVDCNDGNAQIYPGRAEICGDAIDQDCSGGDLVCSTQLSCGAPCNGCNDGNILVGTCADPTSCDGTNTIEDIRLSSASVVAGTSLTVTLDYACYDNTDNIALWYYNGATWRLIQSWAGNLAGCDGQITDGIDGSISSTFTPDSIVGQHVVRAIQASSGIASSGFCDLSLPWGDRDDLAFSVSAGGTCGNGILEGGETCDDGDAIGGDGCSSTCQIENGWSCSGQPSVCTQVVCTLTGAAWSASTRTEGSAVTLTVTGNNCNGQQMNFVVWEDDIIGGEDIADDPVVVNPAFTTFNGNIATTTWITEWQNDALGDPEYYFVASQQTNASNRVTSSAPLLSVSQAPVVVADVVVNGAQQFQEIDGFGVNINTASWDNGELIPALNDLSDALGVKLWRVVIDNSDWEATNDDADPNTFNWAYYNTVYNSAKFNEFWNTISYLNSKGHNAGIMLNFMGPVPSWMGRTDVDPTMEDEWVEMISSLVYYGKINRSLQFGLLAPANEPDWIILQAPDGVEGPIIDEFQYARIVDKLTTKLNLIGITDVKIVGPDTAQVDAGVLRYMPQMTNYAGLMAKLEAFGLHNYAGNTGGMQTAIQGSAYPNSHFWMTEVSNIWNVLPFLDQGANGIIMWDAYDSVYNHGILTGNGNQPPNDAGNGPALLSYSTTTRTYTPRKAFYEFMPLYKFVPMDSMMIQDTESMGGVNTWAFYHASSGRITIVGENTGAGRTITGSLAGLPSVSLLEFYETTLSVDFARRTDVPVSGNGFSFVVSGTSYFVLTGVSGGADTTLPTVSITSPSNGATVLNTITVNATASDNVGVVGVQFLIDGINLGAEDAIAPYSVLWNTSTTSNGIHTLSARARDAAGNNGFAIGVNVNVQNIVPPSCTDADSDGYNTTSGGICGTVADCADNNFGRNPGATEICGDGIDQDCSGADLACPLICVLTDVNWSVVNAVQGQIVSVNIYGTNCNGKIVDLSVYEYDALDTDDLANINPASVVFSGNTATGIWNAEWQCDGDVGGVCTFGNPEYYFNASIRNEANSLVSLGRTAGTLQTTASSATCRNGIQEGTEQCDDGNAINTDACTNSCIAAVCGDNIIRSGVETCDGNSRACTVSGYNGLESCNAQCNGFNSCITTESCGDGILNGNEICDSGANNGQPNNCNSICTGITASVCGNSVQEIGEQCDGASAVSCPGLCQVNCICGIPVTPAIQIISPLEGDSIIIPSTDNFVNVSVNFNIVGFNIGGKGQNHVHFKLSNVPGYSFNDDFMFYNSPDNIVEFSLIPGQTSYATWINSNTIRFNNVPVGSHLLRASLVNSAHAFIGNAEADMDINFVVNQTIPICTDVDLDGYNMTSGGICGIVADCDDTSSLVNPGRTEICNDGIDNNCNSLIDSNDPTCTVPVTCIDVDLDGYNTTSTGICGSVIDCNDGNANINPLAVELCSDSLDNNCNNLIDVNDPVCVVSLPPTITVTSPSNGATISTSSVTVVYTEGGNLTDVNHAHLILDGVEYMDLDNDGSYAFSSVPNGLHTLRVFMARVDHTQIGADRNITFTVSVSSGTGNTGNTGNTGSTGSNSGSGTQVLVVAQKAENDTIINQTIEQISVSDEPSFLDVEKGRTETKKIVDQYGNVYELAFEIREEGVLVRALNGDYLIPSTDIIPVLLGSTEIYMAVESFEQDKARVVMGLNSNAVFEEIKGNTLSGEQARTNAGFYAALGIIIFLIGGVITALIIIWRRNYIANKFLRDLSNK
ncbi:MAG: Ig-like domain-containing protein [Nanoarchaeota archaeon]